MIKNAAKLLTVSASAGFVITALLYKYKLMTGEFFNQAARPELPMFFYFFSFLAVIYSSAFFFSPGLILVEMDE